MESFTVRGTTFTPFYTEDRGKEVCSFKAFDPHIMIVEHAEGKGWGALKVLGEDRFLFLGMNIDSSEAKFYQTPRKAAEAAIKIWKTN